MLEIMKKQERDIIHLHSFSYRFPTFIAGPKSKNLRTGPKIREGYSLGLQPPFGLQET